MRLKQLFIIIFLGVALSINFDAVFRYNNLMVLTIYLFWVGSIITVLGIVLRVFSVLTSRKAFTVYVQINSQQNIIKNGPYKYLSHPAYSGSILSLIGIALCFRSILSLVIISFIYSYRIIIEEKALEKSFGQEYLDYEKSTWRIIPFII